MWTLAIDFGTSNTAGAMFVDGQVISLEVGGERRLPSVVLLDESDHLVVGQEAVNQAVLHADRVERAPKRRLGKGASLLLGGRAVPIIDAVGALLRPYLDEGLRRRNGEPPTRVVLTHPARWSDERLGALRRAAESIGIKDPVFCPEPVAAAVHYADEHLTDGHLVAVYDLGGGTFDTAVLRRVGEGFEVVGLPGGDERIGGEDFDHRLYRHFGELIAREDAALWEQMTTSDDRRFKRANADLLAQSRQAKEALSRNPTARVFLQIADRDLLVTRDEFESLVSDDVDRTVDEMARTIQIAGLNPDHIARLYLAGGASRIPLVQQRMGERFGARVVTWDDPKCVVAMGAAKLLAQQVRMAGPPAVVPPPVPPPVVRPPVAPAPGGPPPVGPPPSAPPPAPPRTSSPPPPPASAQPPPPGRPYAAPSGPRPGPAPGSPSPGAHSRPPARVAAPPAAPVVPGRDKTTIAWVMVAVGLLTCVGSFVGLHYANQAKKQGIPQAQSAFVMNIIVLALWTFCGGFYALVAASQLSQV